jgi:hypothetical protein
MKKIGTILLLSAIISQFICLQSYANDQKDTRNDRSTKKEVEIGNNLLKISETDTSVNVRIGNRGLSVLESLEGKKSVKLDRYEKTDTLYLEDENTQINDLNNEKLERNEQNNDLYIDRNDSYSEGDDHRQTWDNDRESRRENKRSRFKGHWSGLELGFNNYTASKDNFAMPDDIGFMTLHSGKSMNFNLNFAQVSLGITRHIGFVTGPGLNWNNYRFDGNNNIIKGNNGVIEMLDPGSQVKKSKFSTLYLTLPFMLEIQVPVSGNHFVVAAGPIGAVKLDSHSKILYEEGSKVKSDSDFSLNMLRCGATARVGFSNFQFYGTYYATPLFQEGKGPGGHDLFPFEVGLAISFNN